MIWKLIKIIWLIWDYLIISLHLHDNLWTQSREMLPFQHRIPSSHQENSPPDTKHQREFYKLGNPSGSKATCLCKERGNSACTVEAFSPLRLLRKPISKRSTQTHHLALLLLLLLLLPLLLSCTWSSTTSFVVGCPRSSLFFRKQLVQYLYYAWYFAPAARGAFGSVLGGRGCIWLALWPRFRPPRDRSTTWACCCSWLMGRRVEEGMRLWRGLEHRPWWWGFLFWWNWERTQVLKNIVL